jgi:ammonium transporter, Amt family
MVWIGLVWLRKSAKPSTTGIMTGTIAGLAGVTPASGFIGAQNSFFLGIVLGVASYYGSLLIKRHLKINNALDVSSVHGEWGD